MYFYRICDWNEEIEAFLRRYYEEARLSGVIIEGRLPNPDSRQLAYYEEMMGMEFQMNMGFLLDRLQKWLPRMNGRQREQVAGSIYDVLAGLQKAGKNENMLKNGYILGGEQSGHIIFSKHARTGDGILTSLLIMEVILEKKQSLGTLAGEVKIYPQLLKNVLLFE